MHLSQLSIGNQNSDNAKDDDMIPSIGRPCFAGNTKIKVANYQIYSVGVYGRTSPFFIIDNVRR